MTGPLVIQTASEFRSLPGVVEVLPADPAPGYVTLIVEPEARGLAQYLDPGNGDGTGLVPLGCEIRVVVKGEETS